MCVVGAVPSAAARILVAQVSLEVPLDVDLDGFNTLEHSIEHQATACPRAERGKPACDLIELLKLHAAAKFRDGIERTELFEIALGGQRGCLEELGAPKACVPERTRCARLPEPTLALRVSPCARVILVHLLTAMRPHRGRNRHRLARTQLDVHRAEGHLLHVVGRIDELNRILELAYAHARWLRYVCLRRAPIPEHERMQPNHAPLIPGDLEPMLPPEHWPCVSLAPHHWHECGEALPLLLLTEPTLFCVQVRCDDVLCAGFVGCGALPLLEWHLRHERSTYHLGGPGAVRVDRCGDGAHDRFAGTHEPCTLRGAWLASAGQVDQFAQVCRSAKGRAVDRHAALLEAAEDILQREGCAAILLVRFVACLVARVSCTGRRRRTGASVGWLVATLVCETSQDGRFDRPWLRRHRVWL
jgi:hypothetical protein